MANIDKQHGKIKDGQIEYATIPLTVDGKIVSYHPTLGVYLRYGFKEIIDNIPPKEPGYKIVNDYLDENETQIIVRYKYVPDNGDPEPPPQPVRVFSKLYLQIILTKLGYWDRVLTWMKNTEINLDPNTKMNCFDAFNVAVTLSDKFEGFSTIVKAVQNYLGVSDDVVEFVLANSLVED